MTTPEILIRARNAKAEMQSLPSGKKILAIEKMAQSLIDNTSVILEHNESDIAAARGSMSEVMIDRLALSKERIAAMAQGMLDVARLPDPNGKVLSEITRPNGMVISKTMVPMGVIGIIYESRPNVTSDAAVLCFKSSNVCVLRSGKEAYGTSKAIVDSLRGALEAMGINPDVIQLIDDTSRQSSYDMMKAKGFIDLLIPRGGKGLIKACVENAEVPCIETGTGICHVYVEKTAGIDTALNIVDNAKTSRPSVCNACEVCVIDRDIAPAFLPRLMEKLTAGREHPVYFYLDDEAMNIAQSAGISPSCYERAGDGAFDTEYLDYKLAVKTVSDYKQAVEHIAAHSTGHSESIVTKNDEAADYFTARTDSAAVYVNVSTRFTDGGEFGLGCEMGISTQKLHARGPMGLEELMAWHYVIKGNGQVR